MMNDDQRAHDDVLTGSDDAGQTPPEPAADAECVPARPADDGDEKAEAGPSEKPRRRRWSSLTEFVVLFVVALTIALLIKSFVVQPFFIPSGSMENTLLIGDKVLVNKLVYHIRPIERGDIVVFNGSGSWNPPQQAAPANRGVMARVYDDTLGALFRSIGELFGVAPDQTDYIKRVIGVPGDHVVCCNADHQITVNGVALSEKSYIYPGSLPSASPFNIVVPPGRLWVMGDNRADSADSRLHDCAYSSPEVTCLPFDRTGTVPESKVIGRAFMIIWPPHRIRILPIPSTFRQAGLSAPAGHSPAQVPASSAAALLSAGEIPVRPSAPYMPLAAGFASALPLTFLERRLRLRWRGRRRDRRRGLARHGHQRG